MMDIIFDQNVTLIKPIFVLIYDISYQSLFYLKLEIFLYAKNKIYFTIWTLLIAVRNKCIQDTDIIQRNNKYLNSIIC